MKFFDSFDIKQGGGGGGVDILCCVYCPMEMGEFPPPHGDNRKELVSWCEKPKHCCTLIDWPHIGSIPHPHTVLGTTYRGCSTLLNLLSQFGGFLRIDMVWVQGKVEVSWEKHTFGDFQCHLVSSKGNITNQISIWCVIPQPLGRSMALEVNTVST